MSRYWPDSAPAAEARAAWSTATARRAVEILPYLDAAKKAGAITLQQLADALTARGVRTPRGGEGWGPWQVRRVLNRLPGFEPENGRRCMGRAEPRIRRATATGMGDRNG